MNSATVTVRELKNKDTGIDIFVPTLKEIKGLLQSTFEFHVVVVSRLPYFKSPKHKETDKVQFMVPKKFNDFLELRTKLDEKYSATVLPLLPKKSLIVNDVTARERRNVLDKFMQFLACTPKLCTSSVLLEFLGVNAIKAGKFRKDENVMDSVPESKDSGPVDVDEDKEEQESSNLFDEDEEEQEEDLFSTEGATSTSTSETPDKISNDNLNERTKIFEDQDFGGGVDLDKDEDLFLVPGAVEVEVKKNTLLFEEKEEDSDLFNIDNDDIENIFKVTPTKEDDTKVKGDNSTTVTPEKPKPRPKPAPRAKPTLPQKPDQGKSSESASTMTADNPEHEKVVTATKPKPAPRPKPKIAAKPKQEQGPNKENVSGVDNLDTDDIMKYIQQNAQQNDDDDLDLFS